MRALVLLLVFLAGCSSTGLYPVLRPAQRTVGVAVTSNRLLTVVHPVKEGDELFVQLHGRWVPVEVLYVDGDVVELVGNDLGLEMQKGVSGSPVARRPGCRPVALIIGKKQRR